ncbi:MAG: metallophosphoesterase family protein [Fibrobacter sp.]|jgi:3',5'-cyclic AMP phosphodiesterase CpdA|nr:metallophosphoesterase family protein [Fibrobacter sp.]
MGFKKVFFHTVLVFCFGASCSGITGASGQGSGVAVEMLGLTPGASTSELNLNWYSGNQRYYQKTMVRVFKGEELVAEESGSFGKASAGRNFHKATVMNLEPDTRYRYSVSSDGKSWSEEYEYKTPKAGAFRFAAISDPQVNAAGTSKQGKQDSESAWFSIDQTSASGWAAVVDRIVSEGVDFILSAGDHVDKTSGDESEYANFFAPPALRSLPFAPVPGNHDKHCSFMYHFHLPNEYNAPAECEGDGFKTIEKVANYFYLYNNVLFVGLNTTAYPGSTDDAKFYVKVFDEVIEKAKAANSGKYTWLIVNHHKSTATIADHVADYDLQRYVEAGFEKLMDKHGVDLVLAGHDHVYARSYVMKAGGIWNTARKKYEGGLVVDKTKEQISLAENPGTVYITMTTASGIKYYDLFNSSGHLFVKNNEEYPYLVKGLVGSKAYMAGNLPLSVNIGFQHKIPSYMIFEVDGNTIAVSTYEVDKETPVDSFVMRK